MLRFITLIIIAVLAINLNIRAERQYSIYNGKTAEKTDMKSMAKKSMEYDVIFFGEFHDDTIIHQIQKDYLTEAYKLNKKIAVSMEMFERDAQTHLDEYFAGKITEDTMMARSRPWPDYKIFYRPLVELAKSNDAPVVAANIPRKYAAIYADEGMIGIDKLPADERKFITRQLNIREDEYYKNFRKTMIDNLGVDSNKVLTYNQENTIFLYYGAQVVKDETMGESIVNFMNEHKDYKVIHFNGDFHSNSYLGTVQKVMDRNKNLKIAIITPDYVDTAKAPEFDKTLLGKSDFVIELQNQPEKPQMPKSMMGGHLGENYIIKHKISIKLSPSDHSLQGTDFIRFKNPILKKSSIKILKDIKVTSLTSPNGKITYEIKPADKDSLYNEIIISSEREEIFNIDLAYNGVVNHSPNVTLLNVKHSNTPGIISDAKDEGIYLPGGSYFPQADKDLADFDITVTLPKDIIMITSGTLTPPKVEGENHVYTFKSELPTDDMILVGGHYFIKDTMFDGKKFYSYTFAKNPAFDTYLNSSIEYYKLYTKLLGPYPYSSFAIVENFFATGFGMPGYTLLSNKLMAMPWVVLAPGSLAHEFCHNWWGNSVYVDYELGNWCEALTTFSANYYYNVLTKNDAGALDWRKKALLSIASLPSKSNYAVNKFKGQTNNDDATIGYQKGGFIFYEIMKLMGEERFFTAIRNFATKYKGKRAVWNNLFASFDEIAKKDSLKFNVRKLVWPWMYDTGIPTIKLANVKKENDSVYFEINPSSAFYMSVPVKFTTETGSTVKFFTISKTTNKYAVKPDGAIKSIQLDPDYQCLRKLNKWEIPYTFALTLNDNPLLILPAKSSPDYATCVKFAELAVESDYKMDSKSIDELKDEDWADRSIIVLGNPKINAFWNNLEGKCPENKDDNNMMLMNTGHPKDKNKYMTIINMTNISSIDPFRRLFHYLSYSFLVVNKNKAGRPVQTTELFPENADKSNMIFEFK